MDAGLYTRARAIAEEHQLDTDAAVASFLTSPPAHIEPAALGLLSQVVSTGGWVLVEMAIADLPADLRWLFETGAVTLEQLAAIHRGLGITSVADLITEVRRGAVARIPGIGLDGEAAVAAALPQIRGSVTRVPLGKAVSTLEPLLRFVATVPGVEWALPVGSLRRGQDFVGDIEMIAPAADPTPAIQALSTLPNVDRIRHRSERRIYLQLDRLQVGVRCPAPAAAGATLLHLTGCPAHVDRLFHRAAAYGLTLDPDALRRSDDERVVASTEEEIYAALGLPFIPAELRNGDGELEAAAEGRLPSLITRAHIRGDLHMHTHWSDGRDSVDTMVQRCVALGYEYMAITDHSPGSAASRSLSIEGVERQADEIAAARERYPAIAILHGCEVDILANGRLDFPDRILGGFDIVLASLHDRAGHSAEELLRRYLDAMRHPLVNVITHPANRVVPQRAGYDLSWSRLFEAAAETKTVLEVDGAPTHLDLESGLVRRAAQAGVQLAIDSDAHRAETLERHMQLGLLTARRGWVEPRHVLNTLPVQDIRAWVTARRRR